MNQTAPTPDPLTHWKITGSLPEREPTNKQTKNRKYSNMRQGMRQGAHLVQYDAIHEVLLLK